MRHKDLGIWQTWTWDTVFDEVRALSDAMPHVHFVVSYGNPEVTVPEPAATVASVERAAGISGTTRRNEDRRQHGLRHRARLVTEVRADRPSETWIEIARRGRHHQGAAARARRRTASR